MPGEAAPRERVIGGAVPGGFRTLSEELPAVRRSERPERPAPLDVHDQHGAAVSVTHAHRPGCSTTM